MDYEFSMRIGSRSLARSVRFRFVDALSFKRAMTVKLSESSTLPEAVLNASRSQV